MVSVLLGKMYGSHLAIHGSLPTVTQATQLVSKVRARIRAQAGSAPKPMLFLLDCTEYLYVKKPEGTTVQQLF